MLVTSILDVLSLIINNEMKLTKKSKISDFSQVAATDLQISSSLGPFTIFTLLEKINATYIDKLLYRFNFY